MLSSSTFLSDAGFSQPALFPIVQMNPQYYTADEPFPVHDLYLVERLALDMVKSKPEVIRTPPSGS